MFTYHVCIMLGWADMWCSRENSGKCNAAEWAGMMTFISCDHRLYSGGPEWSLHIMKLHSYVFFSVCFSPFCNHVIVWSCTWLWYKGLGCTDASFQYWFNATLQRRFSWNFLIFFSSASVEKLLTVWKCLHFLKKWFIPHAHLKLISFS